MITACCLLHNHIKQMMAVDLLEATLQLDEENDKMQDLITHVESSEEWIAWRDNFAKEMQNTWRASHTKETIMFDFIFLMV